MVEFPICYEDEHLIVYSNGEGQVFIQRKGTNTEIKINPVGKFIKLIVCGAEKVEPQLNENSKSHELLIVTG